MSARLFLEQICQESMAGTGVVCTTVCSRETGTVVNGVIGKAADLDPLDVVNPIGVMSVRVQKEGNQGPDGTPMIRTLSFVRTARRIMDGTVYVPKEYSPTQPR